MNSPRNHWHETTIIYQIYPRSFFDANDDGIGDLRGIIEKFDHLVQLGINAIWLSPIFKSPHADFGYDVEDYYQIDPIFGTMRDFDELLSLAHDHGIKILLDMVLNHTSNKHQWFQESEKNRNNPFRDYYIWRDGKKPRGKKPPNNWKSVFGGSAWTYDSNTEQWYYHHFLPEQPDLNYRNPKVKEEMFKVVKFWLDKGVDGFRLDVIHHIFEDPDLKDNPWSWRLFPSDHSDAFLFQEHKYCQDLPENIEFVRELRAVVDEYDPPRLLLGEVLGPPERIRKYYGPNNDGLHLVFNFTFTSCPFNAKKFLKVISTIEATLPEPYQPCYVLSNHDRPRMISRVRNDERKARLLAFLQLTLRGTPVIYYGEEIGMRQARIPRNRLQDPVGKKFWLSPIPVGRDGCRTPMQWSDDKNAGFSNCEEDDLWLPVEKHYQSINVNRQQANPHSMLSFYRALMKFRKESETLLFGTLDNLLVLKKNVLSYKRTFQEQKTTFLLNFSKKKVKILLNDVFSSGQEFEEVLVTFTTYMDTDEVCTRMITNNDLTLRPLEGIALH